MKTFVIALLASLCAATAAAQDTVVITRPYRSSSNDAERRAVAVFNAPETMRILGAHTIGRSVIVEGDVAVVDGPLRVEGRVSGEIVAINADVEVVDGADVGGDILVLGGHATVDEGARLTGTIEQHSDRVVVRWDNERLTIVDRDEPIRRVIRDHDHRRFSDDYFIGRASIIVTTAGTYNRIEGLPLLVGPRFTWSTQHGDARLEGLGIFRTAASLDLHNRDVGYRALARLRFGRGRQLEAGARAFDQVMPVEDWTLRDDEVGWASLLLHRDYRDYYLARGVGAYGRLRAGRVLTLWADASRFDVSSLDARDPWTPFRNSQVWRANPAVDEGRFTEYRAGFELNTLRDSRWDGGIRLRAEWLHGTGDSISAVALPLTVRDPIPANGYRYDRVWADLRLHQSFAGGALSLRGVAAGDLHQDGPLPMHRRLSLGGPDPMPGYPFHRFACNETVADPASPALCDRMALFQAEYRTGFSIDVGNGDDDDQGWWGWGSWDRFDGGDIELILFANAGAAWIGEVTPKRFNWDAGAGVEIGGLGIYVARALEQGESVRAVLRLHARF